MNKNSQLFTLTSLGILAAGLIGCESMSHTPKGTITKADFGKTPDGTAVELYTLRNSKGMEATIMTYGGIVTSLKTPDRNGKLGDVVLGYDNLAGYIKSTGHSSVAMVTESLTENFPWTEPPTNWRPTMA